MAVGLVTWSQTAASNASADAGVNWAEGQAPSSVNDSARALMSSMAKWRDDTNGTITTGGTSTAYTVTSNQSFAALTAGYMVAFTPHATNGATVTLNVDSLGAKPLRSAPGVELGAAVLIQGTPYLATYFSTNSGEWILHGYYSNPFNIPVGGLIPYTGASAPSSNFVLPYGQALSRSTYSELFGINGTTYGSGDGTTTFNVIDMRGRLPVGWDTMGSSAAGRVTSAGSGIDGSTIASVGGAQTVTITQGNLPNVTLTTSIASGQGSHTHGPGAGDVFQIRGNTSGGNTIQVSPGPVNDSQAPTTASATLPAMTGTTPLGGSGTAVNKMPPGIIVPYILRVM